MLPFEFTIVGPPVSLQTKNRARLQSWKAEVKKAALRQLPGIVNPVSENIVVKITYYYEGDTPDVDNIIKPIQDALIGVIYVDDTQVVDTQSRKRSINGSYQVRGVSSILLSGFTNGEEFLHIRIFKEEESGVLD